MRLSQALFSFLARRKSEKGEEREKSFTYIILLRDSIEKMESNQFEKFLIWQLRKSEKSIGSLK